MIEQLRNKYLNLYNNVNCLKYTSKSCIAWTTVTIEGTFQLYYFSRWVGGRVGVLDKIKALSAQLSGSWGWAEVGNTDNKA